MSDGSISTSAFLVRELRNARIVASLSQEDLGRAINYSSSLVSAVAHLDTTVSAQITNRREDIDRLMRKWEAIRGEALPRAQSTALIGEVAATWQT